MFSVLFFTDGLPVRQKPFSCLKKTQEEISGSETILVIGSCAFFLSFLSLRSPFLLPSQTYAVGFMTTTSTVLVCH